jgi:pimeloyl-ACP methyl ester carboxylesterase
VGGRESGADMPRSGNIYYSVNPEASEELPALILIHGAGGAGDLWPYRIRRLSGYRVFAIDLPGHGRSLGIPERKIENYADYLLDWMRLTNIPKASLVGHSMGSAIALAMAAKSAKQIERLVLLGAAKKFPVNPNLIEKLRIPLRAQEGMNMIVKWSFAKGTDMRLRPAYFKQLVGNRDGALLRDFEACAEFDASAWLADIRQPVTVLSGEEDVMVPLRLSVELSSCLRRASLQSFPDTGHMLMQEKPVEVATRIVNALQDR